MHAGRIPGNSLNAQVSMLFLFLSTLPVMGAPPKSLFYMTSSAQSVQSFLDHADKIGIIVPAWYSTDVHCLIWGGPNPQVMQMAHKIHVEVMPIIGGSVHNGAVGSSPAHRRKRL